MSIFVREIAIPDFFYGTAWKEDDTERLVRLALDAGFRGIDTANQRRHYFEAGVGAAVSKAIADGLVRRDELFLQTKFTYRDGQDHRLPYDATANPATQVRQSFASSLEHLRVESIDSYVLHGPSRRRGLSAVDRQVWRAMEELHSTGRTRFLGVSNVALDQIEGLCAFASVKPAFAQNRCYASTGWDREVRALCRDQGIVYQGFSLLTANVTELKSRPFRQLVTRVGRTPAQIVFRFAQQTGMLPLTGTTDANHMREDLESRSFALSEEDLQLVDHLGEGG
ncbi:MAG TPA: aldo/keto reductase [Thermoanaerobaculia bacterium]|nr:aldo/keto reductase [Thermoanaerobaculia bacterium]